MGCTRVAARDVLLQMVAVQACSRTPVSKSRAWLTSAAARWGQHQTEFCPQPHLFRQPPPASLRKLGIGHAGKLASSVFSPSQAYNLPLATRHLCSTGVGFAREGRSIMLSLCWTLMHLGSSYLLALHNMLLGVSTR